jgi:diguanylate cyclase (GGDEF)-like protein/PAS domain S-box-containing protein
MSAEGSGLQGGASLQGGAAPVDPHHQARVAAESLASAVLDSVTDGILVVARNGQIVRANEAAERILRFGRGSLVGRSISELVPAPQRDRHAGLVRRFRSVGPHIMGAHRQLEGLRQDGTRVPLEVTLTELSGHGSAQVCAVVRDVTERLLMEQQLLHQSLHDPLTGLANRAALQQRLDSALARTARHGGKLALLLMDVDHFKEVNDALGHNAGDTVLATVAQRMASVVRLEDLLARLGGDEFAVVMELGSDEGSDVVRMLAERIREAVAVPLLLDGTEIRPSVSIGVHVTDVPMAWDELMANADISLYDAKAAGRDTVSEYHPRMRVLETHAQRRRTQLGSALAADELVVHYQPIFDMGSGAVVALEALVRWQHPEEGLLQPAEFLPFADRHNLMRAIDRMVLRRALADLAAARTVAPSLGQVWVNLSVQSLSDVDLVDVVTAALDEAGVPAGRLVGRRGASTARSRRATVVRRRTTATPTSTGRGCAEWPARRRNCLRRPGGRTSPSRTPPRI